VTGGNTFIMVLIIGIGIVVYWFVKRQQKKKIEEEVYNRKTTNLLNTLEQRALAKGEVKAYYSELTDIAGTILKRQ
jgi:uncharacterized protein HemX